MPAGPLLLDAAEDPTDSRIDTGWAPGVLRRRGGDNTARNLFAAGLVVLLCGWLLLAAGAWHELRGYRRLRRVEALRMLLGGDEAQLATAQALCRPWLGALVGQGTLPGTVLPAVEAASSMPHLRAVLRQQVEAPLRQASPQEGRTMAVEDGLLTALCPSPALDGVLALLKGLQLVREVARLYALRPGPAVTVALLRRLA